MGGKWRVEVSKLWVRVVVKIITFGQGDSTFRRRPWELNKQKQCNGDKRWSPVCSSSSRTLGIFNFDISTSIYTKFEEKWRLLSTSLYRKRVLAVAVVFKETIYNLFFYSFKAKKNYQFIHSIGVKLEGPKCPVSSVQCDDLEPFICWAHWALGVRIRLCNEWHPQYLHPSCDGWDYGRYLL